MTIFTTIIYGTILSIIIILVIDATAEFIRSMSDAFDLDWDPDWDNEIREELRKELEDET